MKTTIPLASGKPANKLGGIHSLEDYLASAEVAGVQRGTEKLEKCHSEHKICPRKNTYFMHGVNKKESWPLGTEVRMEVCADCEQERTFWSDRAMCLFIQVLCT